MPTVSYLVQLDPGILCQQNALPRPMIYMILSENLTGTV